MADDDEVQKKSSKKSKLKDKEDKAEKKSKKSESKKSSKKAKDDDKKKSKSKKDSKSKSKKRSSKKDKPDASSSTLSLADPSETEATLTESESQLQASSSEVKLLDSSSKLSSDGKKKKRKSKKKRSKKEAEIVCSDSEAGEEDEDAAMRALMEGFMEEMGGGSDDESSSSSSSSSSSGLDYREVLLENNFLDHVVLAAPELEAAIQEFQDKTGIVPMVSGNIKGLGIKTARVSFEGSSFLEIIAPDPEQSGPIGTLLRSTGLTGLVPFHWAIRTTNAEALAPEVVKLGYTPDCIGMTGAKQDGTPRKWEQLYLYGHRMRGMCPFFINWDNSDHPCETMPIVGELIGVTIRAPGDDLIHKLIDHTGSTGFKLEKGSPHFEITFDTPEGEVTLEADKMVGFRFPRFENEVGPIIGDPEEEMPEFVLPEMPEMLDLNTEYDDIPPIDAIPFGLGGA